MASAGGGGAWRRQGRRPHLTWKGRSVSEVAAASPLTCEERADLGAAHAPVAAPAGVALLVPAAAVRKLQPGVMARFPVSDD